MKARVERALSRLVVTLRMKVGVAAVCECGHNLKLTSLKDECRHESMQVDLYIYIYLHVCAETKALTDAQIFWGLHLLQ